MDKESEKIINAIEAFFSTHNKILLPDRKNLIKEQYELLKLEYAGNANFDLQESAESIDITISADSFLICDDGGSSLTVLIGTANMTRLHIIDNRIVCELWFRCWEWIDKNESAL